MESKIEFPLFSSNTKLKRLSERTFEENDLREARLDYIEEVREQIEDAQEKIENLTEEAKTAKTEEKIEIAQMLLSDGDSVEKISKMTGLSISRIKQLDLKNNK